MMASKFAVGQVVAASGVIGTVALTLGLSAWGAHGARHGRETDRLGKHVVNAKAERSELSDKLDTIEDSVHSIEVEQATMVQTLDRVYEEVQRLK